MISKIQRNTKLMAYIQIILGCIIGASAYPMFLVPNSIAPGGLTGIATIVNYFFAYPVGTISLLLNIPLFIIGFRAMGHIFALRSLLATIIFSVLIDILPLNIMTDNMLLASVYGGIIMGLGIGLIFRGGATTGGTDMIARMIHKKFSFISVGSFLFFIDFIVVLGAAISIGAEPALYAIITIFVAAYVINITIQGFRNAESCYIISDNYEKIKDRVFNETERGLTIMHARGGYSNNDKPILLCIATQRDLVQLKQIVREEDEKAFMFVTSAHEVLGEGFDKLDIE